MKFFYISLLLAAMLSMIACSNELEKDKAEVAGLLISKMMLIHLQKSISKINH